MSAIPIRDLNENAPTRSATPQHRRGTACTDAACYCICSAVTSILLLASWIFLRRSAGLLTGSFSPVEFLGFASVTQASLAIYDVGKFRLSSQSTIRTHWIQHGPSISTLILSLTLPVSGSPTWVVGIGWICLIGGTLWHFCRDHLTGLNSIAQFSTSAGTTELQDASIGDLRDSNAILSIERNSESVSSQIEIANPLSESSEPLEAEEETIGENIQQQLTYLREAGIQMIAGSLRISFNAGEQTVTTHVTFCPPLSSKPDVEANHISGPEVRIKVTDAETFGLRLESRRSDTSQAGESVIEFLATE